LGQSRNLDPAASHQEGQAIDHRDCGAAKIAYGEAAVVTPQAETETHKAALAEFRKQVAERHPQLAVETGLMALSGEMEMFS
jgi:carbonic anhydrase